MMPLSPQHLLFEQVGMDSGRRITFTKEMTNQLRRLLLERAHRCVFATKPLDCAVQMRPRAVDAETFGREEVAMWARWHQGQVQAESCAPAGDPLDGSSSARSELQS